LLIPIFHYFGAIEQFTEKANKPYSKGTFLKYLSIGGPFGPGYAYSQGTYFNTRSGEYSQFKPNAFAPGVYLSIDPSTLLTHATPTEIENGINVNATAGVLFFGATGTLQSDTDGNPNLGSADTGGGIYASWSPIKLGGFLGVESTSLSKCGTIN